MFLALHHELVNNLLIRCSQFQSSSVAGYVEETDHGGGSGTGYLVDRVGCNGEYGAAIEIVIQLNHRMSHDGLPHNSRVPRILLIAFTKLK